MNQRLAAFYHYDIQGLRDEIEADMKPGEQIKEISHAMAVAWHNGGNGSPSTHLYYSAFVVFEQIGGEA